MDAIDSVMQPLREFSKDSIRLVKRCHKHDREKFSKVALRTAIGFVVMEFVGFFVNLIFLPINNIITIPIKTCSIGEWVSGTDTEAGPSKIDVARMTRVTFPR